LQTPRLAHPLHQAFLEAAAAAKAIEEDRETIEALNNEQRYRDGFAAAMDAGKIDAVVFPTAAQLPPINGDRNTQLVAEPRPAPNGGPTALNGSLTFVAKGSRLNLLKPECHGGNEAQG